MAQVKQLNQLTKSDFAFSGAGGLIKRGFFNYKQLSDTSGLMYKEKTTGINKQYKNKISADTLKALADFIADNKINTSDLIFFIRESSICFFMDKATGIFYKCDSNTFYADYVIAKNNIGADKIVLADININISNRLTKSDKVMADYGLTL